MKRVRLSNPLSVGPLVFVIILICGSVVHAEEKSVTEASKNDNSTTSSPASSSSSTPSPEVTSTTTTQATTSVTTENPAISVINLLQLASNQAYKIEAPPTLTDFIRAMMKKYGEVKAAEAFHSLDQLPLGLIMKVLLVEVDKSLAEDIVEMQRYAQSSDKALIMMIGRIVAGDKNVPKEIFLMDQKLMKFPWWMRIRQRMFNNLEKYIQAYSLVPVAAKNALNGASKSARGVETPGLVEVPDTPLSSAVAASATESYANPSQLSQASAATINTPVALDPANPAAAGLTSASSIVESQSETTPLKVSLLNPSQQQQILETLTLARAASDANTQAQQIFQQNFQQQFQLQQQQQQQQQATKFNPLAFLLG